MSTLAKVVPIPKGNYSASATYNSLDIVRYDGKSWMCKQDSISNITPTEGAYWMMIVQDGGGATSLTSLSDVTVSSPSNGQILLYNSTSGKWENNTFSQASALNDLTDVSITSQANGDLLTYNATSSKWENKTLELADIETNPATRNHYKNSYLICNNIFYRVTASISAGDNLVEGTNIVATNIGDEIDSIRIKLGTESAEGTNMVEGASCSCSIYRVHQIVVMSLYMTSVTTSSINLVSIPEHFMNYYTIPTLLASVTQNNSTNIYPMLISPNSTDHTVRLGINESLSSATVMCTACWRTIYNG